MRLHFISDLHLDDGRPGITSILLDYLAGRARQADALYLLGDIFEYWLGDDVSLTRYAAVCGALRAVAESGVSLYFMRGNRDFLVSDEFAERTGCRLLEDPVVIDLGGRSALLSHGDLLCTDDVEHQKFRTLVCQPEVRARLLSLPAAQRESMARQIRGMSKSGNASKACDIMDVNQATVAAVMQAHDVNLLIHGHTHRCAMHEFQTDGRDMQRIVLADWKETEGSVLVADAQALSFEILT